MAPHLASRGLEPSSRIAPIQKKCRVLHDVGAGYLAIWLSGYLAIWLSGYLAIWLFGCTKVVIFPTETAKTVE